MSTPGPPAPRHLAGRLIVRSHDHLRRVFRVVRRVGRIARHLVAFHAPDELSSCPACGAGEPVPLLPLPLEGRTRSFGLVSGCRRCGVVFANPLPSAARVAEVYSPQGDWGRHRQQEQEKPVSRARLERLFEPVASTLNVLEPRAGATVLDFGCGLGGMLDGFAALGWQTYGIEPAMKGAFTRHRELTDIPTTGAFDIVVLHHVLEHVTDPRTILRKMSGAVREGGILLISVPNLDDVAVHGELKYCIRADVHVLAYSGACLAWLAADAGFEVVSERATLMSDQTRHRIVLARRRMAPVEPPAAPLGNAMAALARYAAERESVSVSRLLPVRMRAAVLDLQRTEWRI